MNSTSVTATPASNTDSPATSALLTVNESTSDTIECLKVSPSNYFQLSWTELRDIFSDINVPMLVTVPTQVTLDFYHVHSILFHLFKYFDETQRDNLNFLSFLKKYIQEIKNSYHSRNELSYNNSIMPAHESLIIHSVLTLMYTHLTKKLSTDQSLIKELYDIFKIKTPSSVYPFAMDYDRDVNFDNSFNESIVNSKDTKSKGKFSKIIKTVVNIFINSNMGNTVSVSYREVHFKGKNKTQVQQAITIPVIIPWDIVTLATFDVCSFHTLKLTPYDMSNILSDENSGDGTVIVTPICQYGAFTKTSIATVNRNAGQKYNGSTFVSLFKGSYTPDIQTILNNVYVEIGIGEYDYKLIQLATVDSVTSIEATTGLLNISNFDMFDVKRVFNVSNVMTADTSFFNMETPKPVNYYNTTSLYTTKMLTETLNSLLNGIVGRWITSVKLNVETIKNLKILIFHSKKGDKTIPIPNNLIVFIKKTLKGTPLLMKWKKFISKTEVTAFAKSLYRIVSYVILIGSMNGDTDVVDHATLVHAMLIYLYMVSSKTVNDKVIYTMHPNRKVFKSFYKQFSSLLKENLIPYSDSKEFNSASKYIEKFDEALLIQDRSDETLGHVLEEFNNGTNLGLPELKVTAFDANSIDTKLRLAMDSSVPSTALSKWSDEELYSRLFVGNFLIDRLLLYIRKHDIRYIQNITSLSAGMKRDNLRKLLKHYKVSFFTSNLENQGYSSLLYLGLKMNKWLSLLKGNKNYNEKDFDKTKDIVSVHVDNPVVLLELIWKIITIPHIFKSKDYSESIIKLRQFSSDKKSATIKKIYSLLNKNETKVKSYKELERIISLIEAIVAFCDKLTVNILTTLNIYSSQAEISDKVFKVKGQTNDTTVVYKLFNIATNFIPYIENATISLKNRYTPHEFLFDSKVGFDISLLGLIQPKPQENTYASVLINGEEVIYPSDEEVGGNDVSNNVNDYIASFSREYDDSKPWGEYNLDSDDDDDITEGI